jgi:hypothetical protein
MTGKQFETEIINVGQPLKIVSQTITDKVDLQNNIVATGVIIENCVFEDVVFFEQIDLNCGIEFKNCVFKKSLSINDCHASKYDIAFNLHNTHLEFTNTTIEGLYFNSVNEIERGIRIKDNSRINTLKVRTVICKMGGFSINDSHINNLLDISQAKIQNDISIRGNSLINAKVRLENVQANSLVFTDATYNKDIHIWAGKVSNLTFKDGVFNDDLSITGVPILSHLTIIGTEFKKSISFKLWDNTNKKKGKLSKIYIQSGKFSEQFILNGNYYEIEELTIEASKQLEGDIYFNSSNIKTTKIAGNNYNSNLVFNHCNFNQLNFDFFYNYSTISIFSATSFGTNSNLIIQHSNLGQAHLFNVFLNSFEKIDIYNSVMTDVISSNVKWFSDEKLNPETPDYPYTYEQKKEIYRQLKYALEKQGNRIASLNFKGLEMKTFKQESFVKIKWYKKIFNLNRFVLWVGQTNDFGLNWLKPIFFALGFSILFHFLIIIGISDKLNYKFDWSAKSWETTFSVYTSNLNKLPQLMNPTHILSRVFPNKTDISFNVHSLDYLLKVILAFFIFQTISAFRKYIK